MLLDIDPEKYKDFVIGEGRDKVFHVHILKALHSVFVESVFHCNKLRKCIEVEGYQVNPHDVYVEKC